MSLALASSVLPVACASSRDVVAKPIGVTGDASDGLQRHDDSAEIPCEPRRVLTTICQQCHTRPQTKNGAPFPLQWRSDVLAKYGGVEIRELMIEQLSAGRMPLAPVTIDPLDREVLLRWLEAGAPAIAPDACIDAGVGTPDAAVDTSADAAGSDAADAASAEPTDADDFDAGTEGDAEESQ